MKKTYSLALALLLGSQVGLTLANDPVEAPAETPTIVTAVEEEPKIASVVETSVVAETYPAEAYIAPVVEVSADTEVPVVTTTIVETPIAPVTQEVVLVPEIPAINTEAKPSKLQAAKHKAATICSACMALLKDKSINAVQFVGNISKPALKAVTYFGGADWLAKNSAVFKECTNEYVIRTATGVIVITGVTAAILYQIKQALAEINEEDADEENEEIYFDYEG